MRVDLFDFELPNHLIAQHPVDPRDSARMLHIGAALADRVVQDLPELLTPEDLVVVNDTRVLPTRFRAKKSETSIEITLHQQAGDAEWLAFAKPARKCAPGDTLTLAPGLEAEVIERRDRGEVKLRFGLSGMALTEAIKTHGSMPLPPYIKRPDGPETADEHDYQTAFARVDGSVAAPTAGLHFTPRLLARLEARDIQKVHVTLHVGAGTFQPVHAEMTEDHVMHLERFFVSEETAATINRHRAKGGRIVAIGTTSLRTLEATTDDRGFVRPGARETDLFVSPGYRFKCVDRLLTNFHLPRSTLFMLVCAFAGMERMRDAYRHAIVENYRFFSYGDACLLERND